MALHDFATEGPALVKFEAQLAILKRHGVKEFRDAAGMTVVFFDPPDAKKPEEKKR
jgi:hypothetical protein